MPAVLFFGEECLRVGVWIVMLKGKKRCTHEGMVGAGRCWSTHATAESRERRVIEIRRIKSHGEALGLGEAFLKYWMKTISPQILKGSGTIMENDDNRHHRYVCHGLCNHPSAPSPIACRSMNNKVILIMKLND